MTDQKVPNVIERPLPDGVIYDMSTVGQVRITLPESSTWSSGLHWHEIHDEYLKKWSKEQFESDWEIRDKSSALPMAISLRSKSRVIRGMNGSEPRQRAKRLS
jgi:hypothetical protein